MTQFECVSIQATVVRRGITGLGIFLSGETGGCYDHKAQIGHEYHASMRPRPDPGTLVQMYDRRKLGR